MELRPYQQTIVEAVETGWESFERQLVGLATGGGKTIIFSKLAQLEHLRGSKTLILAHREELVDQAIDKLYRATGIIAGKEKAEFRADHSDPVVVASVQTMLRRLDRWPRDHFGLVVVDEAHHAISDSYLIVLRHFCTAENDDADSARALGVTATMDRGDRRNLGEFFQSIASDVGMFDLINQGFLAPISVKSIPLQIDLTGVKQKAGDYDEAGVADALEPFLRPIARAIKEHASFRRTLTFLPLRCTSRDFVEACKEEGLTACHIDGESEDRKEILKDFAAGRYDVVSNAMLLTEGFDDPGIDCVVVLRPTKSRSLYSQMVGRGTRLHPHKEDLLLLDFLWMHEKHKLMRPAHLVAKDDSEADSITSLIQNGTPGPGGGNGEDALDLQDMAKSAKEAREKKLREELQEKASRKGTFISPDAFAAMMGAMDVADYEPTMKWETSAPTPYQSEFLEKAGFNPDEIRGRGHASKIIDLVIRRRELNLCTPKQLRVLKNLGVSNAEKMTFAQASHIMDQRFGRKKPQPSNV